MSRLPIVTDREAVKARLAKQERALARELSELEERARRFEHEERPRYQAWIRLEFGPQFLDLEELMEKIRERRLFVHRIEQLMEREGLSPAEALWMARQPAKPEPEPEAEESPWDADELEARRQAKRDGKRAKRRARQKQEKLEARAEAEPPRSRASLVRLYRILARKLHPDSADALRTEKAASLWHEVQHAYETSDHARLLAVAAWISEHTEGEEPELGLPSSLAERSDRLRGMRTACQRLRRSLTGWEEDPAWGFGTAEAPRLKKLRQRAAREIEGELARMQATLDAFDDFLETLPPARPPKEKGGARSLRRRR